MRLVELSRGVGAACAKCGERRGTGGTFREDGGSDHSLQRFYLHGAESKILKDTHRRHIS